MMLQLQILSTFFFIKLNNCGHLKTIVSFYFFYVQSEIKAVAKKKILFYFTLYSKLGLNVKTGFFFTLVMKETRNTHAVFQMVYFEMLVFY